jgi:hypothetical protein
MKTTVKAGVTLSLALAFFATGTLFSHLVILDGLFGVAYFALSAFGLWESGPYWIRDNRLLSLLSFIVYPAVSSLGLAFAIVFVPQKLFKESSLVGWLVTFICTALIFTVHSPPSGPTSFFTYWTANY